jgi:hypothetical protein
MRAEGEDAVYRWRLARGVARLHDADTAEAARFVAMATRSLYRNESVPTRGGRDGLEAVIGVKRRR